MGAGDQFLNERNLYRSVEITEDGVLLKHYPIPGVSSDTLIIRPLLVGICRSDLKEIMGTRPIRRDFGHEVVGIVEWADTTIPLLPGDLVCLDPHVHISRTSGFGDLLVAQGPPLNLYNAFPVVPNEIPLNKLVFCEPMACAQHAISKLTHYLGHSHLAGMKIGVIGAGMAGTLISMILKNLGALVTIFNRGPERLEFLRERQIFQLHELKTLNAWSKDQFEVVIPTTSFLYKPILEFAIQATLPGGLILLYGGTWEGCILPYSSIDIDRVRRTEKIVDFIKDGKKLLVAGSHGAITQDFSDVIKSLKYNSGAFPVERLITQEVSLSNLPETLLSFMNRPFLGKVVVKIADSGYTLNRHYHS